MLAQVSEREKQRRGNAYYQNQDTRVNSSGLISLEGMQALINTLSFDKEKCIEGDCNNGFGKKAYAKGSIFNSNEGLYIGSFENGKLNGKGTWLMKSNGKLFVRKEGFFVDGKLEGNGFESDIYLDRKSSSVVCNDCYYRGSFTSGSRSGFGELYNHKDILVYSGKWYSGSPWGAGKAYDSTGTKVIWEIREDGTRIANGRITMEKDETTNNKTYYHKNGNVSRIEKPNGQYTTFHSNGNIKKKFLMSSTEYYDEDGMLCLKEINDSKGTTVRSQLFHENGKVKFEGHYIRNTDPQLGGWPRGRAKIYDSRGNVVYQGDCPIEADFVKNVKYRDKRYYSSGRFYKGDLVYSVNFYFIYSKYNGHKLETVVKGEILKNGKRVKKIKFDQDFEELRRIKEGDNLKFDPMYLIRDLLINRESNWVLLNETFSNIGKKRRG